MTYTNKIKVSVAISCDACKSFEPGELVGELRHVLPLYKILKGEVGLSTIEYISIAGETIKPKLGEQFLEFGSADEILWYLRVSAADLEEWWKEVDDDVLPF